MRTRLIIAVLAVGFLLTIPEFRGSVFGWLFMAGLAAAVLLAAAAARGRRR